MRTFAPKPKTTQPTASIKSTTPNRSHFGHCREVRSILYVQRANGSQAVQQLFVANKSKVGGHATTNTLFGRDMGDMRARANTRASLQQKPNLDNPGHGLPAPLSLGAVQSSDTRVRRPSDRVSAERVSGLPAPLQAKLEALSGIDLSDVRVHRNSSRPEQLQALAYTAGRDIYLGPGQDEHLPHEGWHAVQQKQGRVTPTRQAKGMAINDEIALEREADQMTSAHASRHSPGNRDVTAAHSGPSGRRGVIQRKVKITGLDDTKRKDFVAKINEGSVLKFELDGTGFLQQVDPKKTSTEVYSTELVKAIADAQTVILNLITKNDTKFIDSFATGEVDYDDMKSLPFNMFRIWLLHFVVERFALANYEANKATASAADFAAAHKKGHEAQERQLKEWFPKKTIAYKSEGFDAASKVVDGAGNGSIDYVFDFTDVKLVFKQPIVANATKENIISSKIVVVK